jgi:hypothetical protein
MYPDMFHAKLVIEKLGPQGVSDDETDGEVEDPRNPGKKAKLHRRVQKTWRAPYFDRLFQKIDSLRRSTDALGQNTSGKSFRCRAYASAKVDHRVPPTGYPINFYDERWVQVQHSKTRWRILHLADPAYELPNMSFDA